MVPQPPYLSSSLYPQPSSIQQSLPRNPSQLVDVIDIKNLTNRISSKDNLDPQVEKILALMADEFIRNTAEFACKLAKHRDSDTLEKDDVKFAIEKLYNIQVPTKPTQLDQSGIRTQQQINFPQASTNNYKANLALVRKANEQ
ncbi:hypothetical protein FGO68_gene14124 [Halteria grandinella]|uniref:Transcription initiation factor TFIID subunit 12 domain-containing protein n=1 Tax=Halteria grandinella TaxID=5974 RepID=A0A8J8NC97_HALGN|nr:hypothetical protein FGO68_gene14124 [Halteria grandinella]